MVKYRIMVALGLVLLVVGGMTAGASASDVCGPLDSGKIDTSGDPLTVTVTAPEGKLIDGFCVKAGSSNQGDGPRYVEVDPPQKSITFGYEVDGKPKAVSHYSVSYVDEQPTTTTTTTVPETTTTTTIVVTTTTVPETTTTTAVVTTTTEPPTTTTVVTTTTTTEPPTCEDDPSTDENECELPYTGLDLGPVAAIAAGLVLTGWGIVGATQRKGA